MHSSSLEYHQLCCVRVAFRTRLLKGRAMGDSNIVDPYVQEAFDIEGLLLPEDEVKRKSWISFVKDSYISFRSSFKRPNAVALAYELVSSEANVDANIARVEQLLHLGLFRCSRESDPIATFLLHPAITLTLRHLFWNRQESLDPAQFSPLPKETIAFACTIVQNILHQWRDGKGELKIQLTPEVYDPIHQGYVKGIDDFIATYPKAWQHINRQLEDEVFPPG
ncbi:hypothetical protein DL93DRAFT_1206962 [Clavulina sp. PMI_390]|nr:hypothetical protein DL93DRAFT_1206962 [Clavulina sp. PMI_390]